jgi:hypothetical protein
MPLLELPWRDELFFLILPKCKAPGYQKQRLPPA